VGIFFIRTGRLRVGEIVFVLGGTRSGKSSFALREASRIEGRKLFVATAQAYDEEMEERIAKHRSERKDDWETLEEPIDLAGAVRVACQTHHVAIVDCLTIWLSNLMGAEGDIEKAQDEFIESLKGAPGSLSLFIVSNEVGMGIVPENAMARQFRDLAGRLNQRVAEVASRVFFVAAGIPMKIK
jgi:adenosylcobinamide kinase/adenosylcobinamide-phosphate guanylyltransferase